MAPLSLSPLGELRLPWLSKNSAYALQEEGLQVSLVERVDALVVITVDCNDEPMKSAGGQGGATWQCGGRAMLFAVDASQPEPGSHYSAFPCSEPGKSLILTIHLVLVPDDVQLKTSFVQ